MNWLRQILGWIKKHSVVSVVLLILVVATISVLRSIRLRSEGTLTEPIHRGVIAETVYGIGTVTANRSYQLKPGLTSTIAAVYVKEGDRVRKGDRLLDLDRVTFRAPFDGTVTYLPNKVGETVFASAAVLQLVDLSDRYLLVSLEQQGALKIRPNQKVRVSFDSIRQQSYEGKVVSIYSQNSNFFARIDVANMPSEILPGMTADVAIVVRERANALVVPVAAVDQGQVWVAGSLKIPSAVKVKIGIIDSEWAEIVEEDGKTDHVQTNLIQEGQRLLIRKKVGP